MVKENQDQEERIIKLEEGQKRAKYWIAGFSFAVPSLLYMAKKYFGL